MRRFLTSMLITLAFVAPIAAHAQSGDATWLNNLNGLQTAIGRSWMPPMEATTRITEEFGEGTPLPLDQQTQMLSVLVFAFDSPEHASEGLELLNADQIEQIESDPRNPAVNEFLPEKLGDEAYGHEGLITLSGTDASLETAVVYLMVRDGNLVYQIFGQFWPGDHIGITTGIAEQLVAADIGDEAPSYDVNGGSTGGLWEKLNGIDAPVPDTYTATDLEIFPVDDDAVMGSSVVVPTVDPEDLTTIPSLQESWYVAYQSHGLTELVGTPATIDGVFHIELWILEFANATDATATAFGFNEALNAPLGIVTTEGSSFGDGDGSSGLTLVNSGFVRDDALPAGDAATVVQVDGSTIYAARVYANGPAPTPIAQDLLAQVISTPAGAENTDEPNLARGGMWDRFPVSGSDAVFGLELTAQQTSVPAATPVATPRG